MVRSTGKVRRSLLGQSAIAGLMLMTPAALCAQAAPATAEQPAPGDTSEIVVTARGRTQLLQDVPVSVSVVSGAALQSQGIRTLADVTTHFSNVKITYGTAVDQMYIRGIGSGQDPGFEQSVATFVDGVYRSRSRAVRAALFDLDRVEVLKGPQTTFFGANAIAGALNIATRKPGKDFDYNASALYGFSDGEYNVEGGVTVPLSDTFSVRAAARVSGMEGYIDIDPHAKGPNDHSVQGRASARWEPDSNFRSDLRFDIGRSRIQNAFPAQVLNCQPSAPFAQSATTTCGRFIAYEGGKIEDDLDSHAYTPRTFAYYDFHEAAWTNALNVGPGTIKSISGYFWHDYYARSMNIPVPITGSIGGYDGAPAEITERYHELSEELRFESKTGGFFEYMFGGYLAGDKLLGTSEAGFFNAAGAASAPASLGLPPDPPLSAFGTLRQKTRTLSGFASITIRPLEGLRLNAGGRYSAVRKSAFHSNIWGTSVNGNRDTFVPYADPAIQTYFSTVRVNDPGTFKNPKRTFSDFMPSAGVQYDVTHGVMTYFTYSEGFKAGGYGLFNAREVNQYDSEYVKSYEAGVKITGWDHRLTLNLAAFRNNYSNLQEGVILPIVNGGFASAIKNVAAARSSGIEAQTNVRLTDFFSFGADVAYLDAHYIDYKGASCTAAQSLATPVGCTQDMSGKRRPFAPKYSGSVHATITVPAGRNEIRLDPSVNFSSSFFQNATADPLIQQKGFAKLDFRATYAIPAYHAELAIIGTNLTDKITAGIRQPLFASAGSVLALPERGRAVGVQITVHR